MTEKTTIRIKVLMRSTRNTGETFSAAAVSGDETGADADMESTERLSMDIVLVSAINSPTERDRHSVMMAIYSFKQ